MYSEIPQGSVINIQGLDCKLPPEGYVVNVISGQLEKTEIYRRSPIDEECYWERFAIPEWYKDVLKREDEYLKKRKDEAVPFYDETYEEYKRQECYRRLNGFWFYNWNPRKKQLEAIYLTGFYYMLLQWFKIDIGYAKFTIPHLYKTYFLQYCIEDPLCMGMIDVTKRRFLKTFMGGLFILEYISRTKMAEGGLQSKKGNDAKKVFKKAVVFPLRNFPRFFRPEYDTSLGVNPKTEIRFEQTNLRGKKAEDGVDKDELGSRIDWGESGEDHYDGQKLLRYFGDEWGKTVEANVFDRHEVIRYCLLDEEGRIIGKALYSTTVEKLKSEKEGIQESAKELWDASNQNDRGETGMTQSGLYRFFQTSDEGRNFDIYGHPDIEKTIKAIMADRATAKNPRALFARIKKEPRTIEEAFSADADKCVFNLTNIMKRGGQLREAPTPLRSVWFYRKEDQSVTWRDINSNEADFHWEFSWIIKDNANKWKIEQKQRVPDNIRDGVITVDSYSNTQGGRKYGSKAAAWLGRRLDIMDPKNSGRAVGLLFGRPAEKETLHSQVMLAAEYFGYKVWYEHTADDYYSYFKDRGRLGYLGRYPRSLINPNHKEDEKDRFYGTPITPFSLTKQLDTGILIIEEHPETIDFPDLLEQLKKFDPYNRTEYDMVVSWLMMNACLLESPVQKPKSKLVIPTYSATKMMEGIEYE